MKRERIAVALSGGVDSAVAAALLVRVGKEVIGIHGKEWSGSWGGNCPSAADADAARAVAKHLGISFHIVNCERAYRHEVFSTALSDWAAGRTPNPDVACNRIIKFGVLIEAARGLAADALATGHYAQRRVVRGNVNLMLAKDTLKDQTYFLSSLSKEQVSFARFPLGSLTKAEVRSLARRLHLPVADRPDSMGLCFVGPDSFRQFIRSFLPDQPGAIRTPNGTTLGTHPGIHLFTIGQRHGLGLAGGPFYVAAKNAQSGTLTVVKDRTHPRLSSTGVIIRHPHWITEKPRPGENVVVRFRHQQPFLSARISSFRRGLHLTFMKPAWAVAVGQQLMVVQGRRVLGGGTMDTSIP